MARALAEALLVAVLATLSLMAALAWVLARLVRRGPFGLRFGLGFALVLAASWGGGAVGALPRVALGMSAPEALHVPRLYRWTGRDFVTPKMRAVAQDLARHMADSYPGTITVALDGGHPLTGLPLVPHLSHDDGEKLDLGLYWQAADGTYRPAAQKSPLGYWGYAEGPTECPRRWADLRWDFLWAQPLMPDLRIDPERTRAALLWLAADPRVSKILIEPHIPAAVGISHPKIRFQGCRAARHDDHIHIQL